MAAVFRADGQGHYLDANDEALGLLGISLTELRASRIGDFSGPNAEMALTVWRRLASSGEDMSTGESTLHRADGSRLRVRYLRIEAVADAVYELEAVEIPLQDGSDEPISDRPSTLLREWRAAEREVEAATSSSGPGAMGAPEEAMRDADGLRRLYGDSVAHRERRDRAS